MELKDILKDLNNSITDLVKHQEQITRQVEAVLNSVNTKNLTDEEMEKLKEAKEKLTNIKNIINHGVRDSK
jgi:archaellum component FlaC